MRNFINHILALYILLGICVTFLGIATQYGTNPVATFSRIYTVPFAPFYYVGRLIGGEYFNITIGGK